MVYQGGNATTLAFASKVSLQADPQVIQWRRSDGADYLQRAPGEDREAAGYVATYRGVGKKQRNYFRNLAAAAVDTGGTGKQYVRLSDSYEVSEAMTIGGLANVYDITYQATFSAVEETTG